MRFLQDFLDRSKQLNQTPTVSHYPAYHGPNSKYKIIHQGLMIPGLPAPLHYLNFLSIIGQPNAPMLANPSAIQTNALDTATVICSTSSHMVGQLHRYSVQQDCNFDAGLFQFLDREQLSGAFPHFRLQRFDSELSFDLSIHTTQLISHFSQVRFSLAEHWSLLCYCQGTLKYKQQTYNIDSLGSFEYARSFNFPYLPLAFLTYQIINLSENRQLLLAQIRDGVNSIVQSRMYLRDLNKMQTQMFDQKVYFKVHRVYPRVTTPNGQNMYLPREFEWCYEAKDGTCIWVQGQSRGDFKFGLAAGYVGSFSYQVKINEENENGEGGYCEYIDCRPLRFQEQDKTDKLLTHLSNSVPLMLKK
ncbi:MULTISPECIES: DUF6670 family protein [Acinetobacter]|uniref:Uncharacterized protein n=1 Tax=Acinetobacter pseudolwoffii TaxID=2053287 RepID=N9KWR5_9GAMM|nr:MULTISPECIES: DUF6670 family protein [Acinetobacter]ENW26309.1 hypothetical protein F925_00227 [Acinetobacter lwoffii NCTC 5866 = CIP 64.10 = NIPH 512]NLZ85822.1 hypothetical protein [Gammaproteobacteria bacterium]ENW88487.1 hypothetical protein F906_00120 [Acinetobacter pseudolwoffii]MCP0911032.1 hypothetical protein [Acinetobacter pseudolwoffii]MDH5820061.1 hypothetical protein [Acinetobacter pseudolwoffii]